MVTMEDYPGQRIDVEIAYAQRQVQSFIDAEFAKLSADLDAMVPPPPPEKAKSIGQFAYEMLLNTLSRTTLDERQMAINTQGSGTFGSILGNPHISGQARHQVPNDVLSMLGLNPLFR